MTTRTENVSDRVVEYQAVFLFQAKILVDPVFVKCAKSGCIGDAERLDFDFDYRFVRPCGRVVVESSSFSFSAFCHGTSLGFE
jgi:hypothetical protein